MSILEGVQFVNKYNRGEACVKFKNMFLINIKIELYKGFKKGDDPIYLVY